MHALFATDDLMITSQVRGVAEASGCALEFVRTTEQITEVLAATSVSLVMLDLEVSSVDVAGIVKLVKGVAPGARIVAFGPHVKVELLQAAKDAGCDQVMSRGEFTRRLKELFQR